MATIVIKNLKKSFIKKGIARKKIKEVLRGINLLIKEEVFGFIGPNGAGKSTMMKIITGFLPQTEGNIFVNGQNILDDNINIRRKIGYLPEHNPLYLDMYIREYLRYTAGFTCRQKR